MIDQQTAQRISENLSVAFDHLREAILLALAGPPTATILSEQAFLDDYSEAVYAIKNGPGTVAEKADLIAAKMLELTGKFLEEENADQEALFEMDPTRPISEREYEQAAVDLSHLIEQDEDPGHSVKVPDAPTDEEPDGGEVYEPEEDDDEDDDFSALFDEEDDEDSEPETDGTPPAAF